jgi:oligosaccharide repeat unit polymerase
VDALRGMSYGQDFQPEAKETHLTNYMFGSPAAFADWYAHNESSDPDWGARTFAGEFDLLQIKGRTVGMYLETSNVVSTEITNVYTLFRNLIEDFTLLGATVICACIGGLTGWIYIRTRENSSLSAVFWLSAYYAAMVYSPIVSLFSFNGAILAWVVAWLVLRNLGSQRIGSFLTNTGKNESRRFSH